MRAVLDGDVIVKLTIKEDIGTEVGPLPKGVGLERLRFDGKKVVDLAELSEMWVEQKGGAFVLHAIPVPNAQLVQMRYQDRKSLSNDAGEIRLKTELEKQKETESQQKDTQLFKDAKAFTDKLIDMGTDNYAQEVFAGLPSEAQKALEDICNALVALNRRNL